MEVDEERQQQAREYARKRRTLSWIGTAITVILLILVLITGLDKWLRDQIQSVAGVLPALNWHPVANWYPLQIIVYFLVIVLVLQILDLPFAYYGGFILPRRYGISVMTLKAWLGDLVKGEVLGLLFQGFLVSLIYALVAFQPQTWWLWVALCILLFSILMVNLAPVLIFPLFYKLTPLPEGELTQRLVALANRAQTQVRGVFSMKMSNKTTATNAALMGLGNTRRIVLGDTMIDRYTPDEIEVVLAHELGHHVHNDLWKMIFIESFLILAGLYVVNVVLHWVVDVLHYYQSLTDPATLLFLALLTGIFSLIIMPINNGISRYNEYQADEYALQATQKVEDFKSAMTRLANQNLTEIEPSPMIEFLFHSHPSIRKRLQHADEFANRQKS